MPFTEPGECGNGGSLLDYGDEATLHQLSTRTWIVARWTPPTNDSKSRHDHCAVCWWALGESDDPDESVGMTDGRDWMCRKCHEAITRWARTKGIGPVA